MWTIAACDVFLDRRIAIVARVRTLGPLVARLLRPLPANYLDAIQITFNDQGGEGGEYEGETASAENGYEVRESHRGRGAGRN